MSEKVKFYRGNTWDRDAQNEAALKDAGEIVFVNDAFNMDKTADEDGYDNARNFGSIYQDDKIVGTTKANELRLTEEITVAGGPLADDTTDNWPEDWKDASGNKVLPKGLSMQDILLNLFLKEKEGSVSWSAISWDPKMGNPTATLSSNGPVEVGTTVTATIAANLTVTGNTRKATMTASAEGYFNTVGGSHVNSTSKVVSVDGSVSGTATTTHTWNGTTTTETSFVVTSGTNTLNVTNSGITASVDALPETTVYASTNTKKCISSKSAKLSDTKPSDKTLTATSASDTIEGKYYYYYGSVNTADFAVTNDVVKGLSKDWADGLSESFLTSGKVLNNGETMIVACPSNYSLTQVLSALGSPELANFTSDTLQYVLPNSEEITYNVYYFNINADNYTLKEFKIEKN